MIVPIISHTFEKILIKLDPVLWARKKGVGIGENCRLLGIKPGTFSTEPYLITIGDHVTITSGVQFVTHDGGVWVFREEHKQIDVFGRITIGDNVFIGIKSIILPSVIIGANSVVGAGSIVPSGNYPPNSVIAGNPAKVIKSVGEYKEKVMMRALFIRDKDASEKKKIIKKIFFGIDNIV